jgi:hypothetical protein
MQSINAAENLQLKRHPIRQFPPIGLIGQNDTCARLAEDFWLFSLQMSAQDGYIPRSKEIIQNAQPIHHQAHGRSRPPLSGRIRGDL